MDAHWGGFVDAQSGISLYRWGAGTSPGLDNVVPFADAGLATVAWLGGLSLHDGLVVYVTVVACNHADQCVTVSSDGIVVDGSAPVVVRILFCPFS